VITDIFQFNDVLILEIQISKMLKYSLQ
jgi:hypothetical protein